MRQSQGNNTKKFYMKDQRHLLKNYFVCEKFHAGWPYGKEKKKRKRRNIEFSE